MIYSSMALHVARFMFACGAAALLAGCALAPGMHFDSSDAEMEPAGGNAAVKPVIKAITQQLIDEERQLAESGKAQDDLAELMEPAHQYRIGVGDQLSIIVWDHPELDMPVSYVPGSSGTASTTSSGPGGYAVDSEGRIQFPYAGDVKVEGLTESQARDLLVERLVSYIKKPEVTLRIVNYRSKRVYVDGEVKQPGIVQIDDIPLSLPEAISRAGGITSAGDQSRVKITRSGKTYWVNLPELIARGGDPSRIMLKNGDMLRVSSSDESKVYVIGEVIKPASVNMLNGHLSLNQALGEAGGINPATGDGNLIYVIRNANEAQPVVYHLSARSPVMLGLADNFELKPKDVVYVDSAPIVRYNRIIGLIIPTTQEIVWVNRGFK